MSWELYSSLISFIFLRRYLFCMLFMSNHDSVHEKLLIIQTTTYFKNRKKIRTKVQLEINGRWVLKEGNKGQFDRQREGYNFSVNDINCLEFYLITVLFFFLHYLEFLRKFSQNYFGISNLSFLIDLTQLNLVWSQFNLVGSWFNFRINYLLPPVICYFPMSSLQFKIYIYNPLVIFVNVSRLAFALKLIINSKKSKSN